MAMPASASTPRPAASSTLPRIAILRARPATRRCRQGFASTYALVLLRRRLFAAEAADDSGNKRYEDHRQRGIDGVVGATRQPGKRVLQRRDLGVDAVERRLPRFERGVQMWA